MTHSSTRWRSIRALALVLGLVAWTGTHAAEGDGGIEASGSPQVPAVRSEDAGLPDGGAPVLPSDAGTAAEPAPAPSVDAGVFLSSAAVDGGTAQHVTVALLRLEANKPAADQAEAVSTLLASRLADAPGLRVVSQADVATLLGIEKQRQLLGTGPEGCTDTCMVELSGAVGARYVGAGRVDRFGARYLLSFTLFDAQRSLPLLKTSAEAGSDAELPDAVDQVVHTAWSKLGVGEGDVGSGPSALHGRARDERLGISLAFKAGSNFVSSLRALSPAGQLDIGYRFAPEWEAFLQIGIAFVSTDAGEGGSINVVPGVLGVRKLYFIHNPVQPYWGLALGVQLSFGQFGIFTSTGTLPTIIGLGGLQWQVSDHVSLLVELSTNIAHATLGLATGGLGSGLNLDGSLGVLYRF